MVSIRQLDPAWRAGHLWPGAGDSPAGPEAWVADEGQREILPELALRQRRHGARSRRVRC